MNEAYTIIHSLDEFQATREQFGHVVNKLQSEETSPSLTFVNENPL